MRNAWLFGLALGAAGLSVSSAWTKAPGPQTTDADELRPSATSAAGAERPQAAAAPPPASSPPTRAAYLELADEMERHWQREVLPLWFPRCVDREHGGFRPHFLNDWTPGTQNDKTIVFQSRMIWVAAQVAQLYPELRETYADYTRHGMRLLAEKLWDVESGGFYWGLDATAQPSRAYGDEKHAYGIAFAIYAASAAYELSQSPGDLELAQRAFAWLEQHAHDRRHGGYFEALTRSGEPILTPPPAAGPAAGAWRRTSDFIGTAYGYKSMNTHIHLLEALTALHHARPDSLVEQRLREVYRLVRDTIAVEPGCLHLYFTPDWRPTPDHDSFGHDVETAFLLLEAAAELREPDEPRTLAVARSLVDHALERGWDENQGGFYDQGSAFGAAHGRDKIWWTQAEGLNALLVMHERFAAETPRYFEAFLKQREFIWRYQIDHQHGEWYERVRPDGRPVVDHPKGSVWKAAYHNGRALMNVADLLRRLAREPAAAVQPRTASPTPPPAQPQPARPAAAAQPAAAGVQPAATGAQPAAEARPEPAESAALEFGYADSGGVPIHYVSQGAGPLVLLIHGFPDYWYGWRDQMAALAPTHQAVAIDQRGYNTSGRPAGVENYAIDKLVGDVATVLRHLRRERATIVGHDWGGAVAWAFAMQRPELTERLIILNCPHPRGLLRELATNEQQRQNSAYAREFQKPSAAKALSPEMIAFWVKEPDARQKYVEAFRRSSLEAMLNYYQANYPREPYAAPEFPQVKCPTLVLHGLDDTALLPGALAGTWQWIDNELTIITIPKAGHWVHRDATERVNRALVDWLARPARP